MTVVVMLTTTLSLAPDGTGNPATSSWSDPHRITLTPAGGSFVVTADTVLDASR